MGSGNVFVGFDPSRGMLTELGNAEIMIFVSSCSHGDFKVKVPTYRGIIMLFAKVT